MSLSCRNLKWVSPLRRCSGGDASTSAASGPIRRIRSARRSAYGAVGPVAGQRGTDVTETGATAMETILACNVPAMSDLETAVVNARGAARIAGGHPWVFRTDIVRGPKHDATDGGPSMVRVGDGSGRALGVHEIGRGTGRG